MKQKFLIKVWCFLILLILLISINYVSSYTIVKETFEETEKNYYIVQFNFLPTGDKITQLELKMKFHRYLGDYQFVCEIPDEMMDALKSDSEIINIIKINPLDKISNILKGKYGEIRVLISTYDLNSVYKTALGIKSLGGTIHKMQENGVPRIWASIDNKKIKNIAEIPDVYYIDYDYDKISFMNLITSNPYMGMDAAQTGGFKGSGIMGAVQDNGCQLTHPDFDVDYTDGTVVADSHGTCTYGIVFSLGTNDMNAQGTLYQANSAFQDWDVGIYNSVSHCWNGQFSSGNAGQNGLFQSNSWSSGGTLNGQYDSNSNAADTACNDFPNCLVLWAAGNSNNGVYKGSISKNGASKNGLTIGAVWHDDTADMSDDEWYSGGTGNTPSQGPCADGRQKPDVVGPFDWIYCTDRTGSNGYASGDYFDDFGGTSGATPSVAGIAGQTYEMYIENYFGNNPTGEIPSSAMIKAILIADAYQYSFSQTDRDSQGWGSADAEQIYTLGSTYHVLDDDQSVTSGGTWSRSVSSDGTMPLKISLVWNDPAAPETTGSNRALRNNLDLKVTGPTGTVWYGNNGLYNNLWSTSGTNTNHWTINSDHRDDLNNVENVFIQNPEAGSYTIEVFGRSGDMYTSPQVFSVASAGAQITTPPSISIITPNGGEEWEVATSHNIIWATNPGNGTITSIDLQYSIDNGENWNNIITGISDDGLYNWLVPNNPSTKCLVKGIVHDNFGALGSDTSNLTFNIHDGILPQPPSFLNVEYYGLGNVTLLYDDAEQGNIGFTTGGAENWAIRTLGAYSGSYSWDFGNGNYEDPVDGGLSYLCTPLIDLNGLNIAELSFWHWRDFESDSTLWDGGNIKISINEGVSWSLLSNPNPAYDGSASGGYDNPLAGEQVYGHSSGWEQVTIDLTSYVGNLVYIRWEAGVDNYATTDAGWRIDDVLINGHGSGVDNDNRLFWNASYDDGYGADDVDHYNIYRSNLSNGPWDLIYDSVDADGSLNYCYIDFGAGLADAITWWYVVKAVDIGGLDDGNNYSVSEPSGNNPPNTPSNPNPFDGETGVDVDADLGWVGGDPDQGDTVTYDIYFGTTSPPPQLVTGQSGTSYDPGTLNYNMTYYWKIVSWDNHGAFESGSEWYFITNEIGGDTSPPIIYNENIEFSNPIDTDSPYGWENITCNVVDVQSGVAEVRLNITYPDLSTTNYLMQSFGGDIFYYETTYSMVGNYSYNIWAKDTINNWDEGIVNTFSIAPNWDVDMDGITALSDLVQVSIDYDQNGPNGWIREDVDNDGDVLLADLVQVSLHYDETWPTGSINTPVRNNEKDVRDTTYVSVDPPSQTVGAGEVFTIDILVNPGEQINGVELDFIFDPSLIQANSVTEGDLFDPYTTFFNGGTINNVAGTITAVYGFTWPATNTVSDQGVFITIEFISLNTTGTSQLHLCDVGITDETGFYISNLTVSDGSVLILGLNDPPYDPIIDGPTGGTAGEEYTYEVVTTDPEGDDVIYCVDFGDDSGEVCIGPFPSGISQSVSHIWEEEGTYIVKVKASDIYGAESNWTTLEVVMPQNQQLYIYSLLQKIGKDSNAFFIVQKQYVGI